MRLCLIGVVSVMCLPGFSPGFATPVGAPLAQGLNLISVNDEIELGRQTQTQARSETPLVSDSAVSGYLNQMPPAPHMKR